MEKWNHRWQENDGKTGWTKRLTRNIENWQNRKHGQTNYFITQFLTGHGCFGTYLNRIKEAERDSCIYYGEMDNAEHAIIECGR